MRIKKKNVVDRPSSRSWAKRALNYSALAAAGLLVEPATAGVITSGPGFTPIHVAPGQTKVVDFGSGLGAIFQFAEVSAYSSGFSAVLQRGPAAACPGGTCQQFLFPGYNNNPARLGNNYAISVARAWFGNVGAGTTNDIAGISSGSWNAAAGTKVQGFLGVRFTSTKLSAGYHYGYFDISYDNAPSYANGTMTIGGWAYDDQSGVPITTPDGGVPEPATMLPMGLGLLALGAAGIRAKRSRQNATA